jgi:hypothetical protein
MQSFDQAKFALTLVQNWPCQNEVITQQKKSKNHHIKSATFLPLKIHGYLGAKPLKTTPFEKGLVIIF